MFSILDDKKLTDFLLSIGEKKYRLNQIHQALFKDLAGAIDQITTIPTALRESLEKETFLTSLELVKSEDSQKDATTKVVFKTSDNMFIESVLMRHLKGRITLCVSSQVGCAMGCTFCATGKLGFFRNLHFYEIVDQVLHFDRLLKAQGQQVRNIVFMGMGEPMLNYQNVIEAVHIINAPKKLEKGARHITISTCGIVPGIEQLINAGLQVKLAISLHAPSDELRKQIMPIELKYPLETLMKTLDKYTESTNKRIFYEYVMLQGVNDTPFQAETLGKLLKGRLAHVNLIPWNPVPGIPYGRSESAGMKKFQEILERYGIPSTIRVSLGDDIAAACGQLAKKNQETQVKPRGNKLVTIGPR